jgi:hypothetical protein
MLGEGLQGRGGGMCILEQAWGLHQNEAQYQDLIGFRSRPSHHQWRLGLWFGFKREQL